MEAEGDTPSKRKTFDAPKIIHGLKFQPSMYYEFSNERRGKALIFNQVNFDLDKLKGLKERKGSDVDVKRLKVTLKKLHFHDEDIKVHTDLTKIKILIELENEAKNINENCHEFDCLIVVMMTHGNSHGQIYAFDKEFSVNDLWSNFDGILCKGLSGKPKLFFVQACRGKKLDFGTSTEQKIAIDSDSTDCMKSVTFVIPTKADTLFMYSTIEGYPSFRSPIEGTWFIQTLCEQLDLHHENYDLLSILTLVMNDIAYKKEFKGAKQLPHINSMLTKFVYFGKKKISLEKSFDETDQSKDENGN